MKVQIITNCPSCNSTLHREKDQLFCTNIGCVDRKTKEIVNFAKVMQIRGLGEKTIEKLQISDITDIYSLTQSAASAALGEKLGTKLLEEIEKSKVSTIDKFLAACSIKLIGPAAAKKVANHCTHPSELTEELCKRVGLGTVATNHLLKWKEEKYPSLIDLPISFESTVVNTTNTETKYTVCISGKLNGHTKASAENELQNKSVKVINTVNKSINYLICDNPRGSSKETKAEQLGIEIITFEKFLQEIK